MITKDKPVISKENQHRFHNFVLFEPSSLRLSDQDILFIGSEVKDYYYDVINKIALDESIKSQIIKNRITKIGQMINLLKSDSQLIMTKFFDNVWKRYNFVSNLGEYFIDYTTFTTMFPDLIDNNNSIVTQRFDSSVSVDLDDDKDDSDDETLSSEQEPVIAETKN